MPKSARTRWAVLVAANVLFFCGLSFYRTGSAAPRGGGEPFANAVQQRGEMVRVLTEIRALLKEQNALLRSGKLKVVVEVESDDGGP